MQLGSSNDHHRVSHHRVDRGVCTGAGYVTTGHVLVPEGPDPKAAVNASVVAVRTKPASQVLPNTEVTTTEKINLAPPEGSDPRIVENWTSTNIHSGPSLKAKVEGTAIYGIVLDVTGVSADGKWYRVKYKDAYAWVSAGEVIANSAAATTEVIR